LSNENDPLDATAIYTKADGTFLRISGHLLAGIWLPTAITKTLSDLAHTAET
jgi:hypothetical protein